MEKLFSRSSRISQELQKKIAFIIQNSLSDSRINLFITVSEVTVSKDLSFAKVFVSFLENDKKDEIKNNLIVLNQSVSYIRKLLCKKIKLRIIPNIIFYHDDSFLRGDHISMILDNLIKKK